MICPQCRSIECFRSHRAGFADFLFTLGGCRPWRCRSCELRFYAWRVALRHVHLAHCPKCGNFDLERISRDRVDQGTLRFAKRMLQVPAYRCDPCRERFFTVRPFRRVVASTGAVPEPKMPVAAGTGADPLAKSE